MTNSNTALDDFLTHYFRDLQYRGRSYKTARTYARDIRHFFCSVGKVDPRQVTAKNFQEYDYLLANQLKVSQNTRSRHRSSLRSFWKFLHKEHGLENIAEQIPQLQKLSSDPHIIHPDDLIAILHAQDEKDPVQARNGALLAFLAATGLRRSEVLQLKMEDISFNSTGKCFIVRAPCAKPVGRTRLVNFGNFSEKGDIVSYHFGIWFALRIMRLGGNISASKYPVFAQAERDNQSLTDRSLFNCIQSALKRANIPRLKHIGLHTLRHFYATMSKANGADIWDIKENLGHRDLSSTQKYIHLAEIVTAKQALEHGPLKNYMAKPSMIHNSGTDGLKILQQIIPRSQL